MVRKAALRVLVVEDEAMVLMGFKTFLHELGHIVIGEAYDGAMAVELAQRLKPDLILMDVSMPKLDGIRALKSIHDAGILCPCVFITAYSEDELLKRAVDEGAYGYLVKPITIDGLKAAIEVALKKFEEYSAMQDELKDMQEKLEVRKLIERAKGILMDEFGFKEQQAMDYLQKKSRNSNKKVSEIARELIRMNGVIGNEQ